MANVEALYAVAAGLARQLTLAHQVSTIAATSCKFSALGTTEMRKLDGQDTTLSINAYRFSLNEHTRNANPQLRIGDRAIQRPPLSVNVHLLLTAWAASADRELRILAWVMRELHQRPLLDASIVTGAGLQAGETIQFIPEELSLDDLSKFWQALAPPLRPSVSYIARNVLIAPDAQDDGPLVVVQRFALDDEVHP